MLRVLGLEKSADLFDSIPSDIRLKELLNTRPALSEIELISDFEARAAQNIAADRVSFLGAGAYSHYSPTIVDSLIQRSEFFTAYTPYQPEIAQGTLQAIFEFQTLICQVTGMDVANASMYDGSTALAEAVLMAGRITGRHKVVISRGVHPEYIEVVRTYVQHAGIGLEIVGIDDTTGLTKPESAIDQQTAALVVQSPNFFGAIEGVKDLTDLAHENGALLISVIADATSLGILRSPGESGADIAVAEGQSFGVPLSYGGPYVGIFAARERFIRQMPGRLVGIASDKKGRRGFVLTLKTREQDIRREKATSNICTNQGLIALAATIYLSTMGRRGLQEVASQCLQKTAYAKERIAEAARFSLPFSAPTYNEFVIRAPVEAEKLLSLLASEKQITGGLALSRYFSDRPNDILICVTETNSRQQIDQLVAGLKSIAASLQSQQLSFVR